MPSRNRLAVKAVQLHLHADVRTLISLTSRLENEPGGDRCILDKGAHVWVMCDIKIVIGPDRQRKDLKCVSECSVMQSRLSGHILLVQLSPIDTVGGNLSC